MWDCYLMERLFPYLFTKLQRVYNVYNSPSRDQIVALDKMYIMI